MDKSTYVKRLKKMLTSKENNECQFCPAARHYDGGHFVDNANCKICQNFVGLKHRTDENMPDGACPCHRLKNPIERAWLAIEAYEEKHDRLD